MIDFFSSLFLSRKH